ncbi:MAG: AraC family transcriptional regulator [Ruminococcaceae bacterium]|nr:AraC family transcriptional regulator [Oscillospiraceae bacterium]
MNTLELEKILDLKCITQNNLAKNISGCYISDLLSLAMGRVGEENVWITVQTNVNIVAIASLTEAACIIVPEDIKVPEDVVNKAKEEDIIIFSSSKTAYEIAKLI